jgi:hypothetical protein
VVEPGIADEGFVPGVADGFVEEGLDGLVWSGVPGCVLGVVPVEPGVVPGVALDGVV